MNWMNDADFIRGDVPMTKEEVRILTVAGLELSPGLSFLDGCEVTAAEVKDEALDLIEKNAEAFDVEIDVIHGKAPACLKDESYDRIFIGGSRGQMEAILEYAHGHLKPGGIMAGNFITMSHAEAMKAFFKKEGYDWRG